MGLDVYLYKHKAGACEAEDFDLNHIELPSKLYPDHLFKIGYFRSSYNDAGINRVLRLAIGETLDSIMGAPKDEYCFAPDWSACIRRANDAKARFEAHVKEHGSYGVFDVDENPFSPGACSKVDSAERALELFQRHRAKERGFDKGAGWYSNIDGHFMLGPEPPRIRAIIPGVTDGFAKGRPCSYVIWEKPDLDQSYVQSLEIVIETCEWVLSQKKPSAFRLHWSS